MRHIGNKTNFQRLLKLVFTFSTKNIMDTIEEGILINVLVCSAPNLKKLEIRHFGNKPFNYASLFPQVVKLYEFPRSKVVVEFSLRNPVV